MQKVLYSSNVVNKGHLYSYYRGKCTALAKRFRSRLGDSGIFLVATFYKNTGEAGEAARGKQTGRTVEIQRLIGRALRAVVDLKALGERSITVDCDVIQADGGTRTASITGAFVALVDAVDFTFGGAGKFPITDFCAAISVGIGPEGPITDLCYEEDSAAIVDMNVVRTALVIWLRYKVLVNMVPLTVMSSIAIT